MTYCISDIHGDYPRFCAMLEMIRFSEEDELYILGDVVDRGADGVDILLDIIERKNVHMLLGNHEAMLLATLGPNHTIGARKLWTQNGGSRTYHKMIYDITAEQRGRIIHFLLGLPDHLQLSVNGRQFYLVHGNVGVTQEERIWNSPNPHSGTPPIPGTTLIVGHTCTCYMRSQTECNETNHFTIYHGCGWFGIDCGCGYPWTEGRLACLRLEDMAAFYV